MEAVYELETESDDKSQRQKQELERVCRADVRQVGSEFPSHVQNAAADDGAE
jgi:hypothetical protein